MMQVSHQKPETIEGDLIERLLRLKQYTLSDEKDMPVFSAGLSHARALAAQVETFDESDLRAKRTTLMSVPYHFDRLHAMRRSAYAFFCDSMMSNRSAMGEMQCYLLDSILDKATGYFWGKQVALGNEAPPAVEPYLMRQRVVHDCFLAERVFGHRSRPAEFVRQMAQALAPSHVLEGQPKHAFCLLAESVGQPFSSDCVSVASKVSPKKTQEILIKIRNVARPCIPA